MSRTALALVALAAVACGDRPPSAEDRAREAFVEGLAAREGHSDLWRLMSRLEVVFEEGWSRPMLIAIEPDRPWRDVTPPPAPASRGTAVRWMGARAHLRVRGDGPRRLRVWGHVDRAAIFTRPRLTVTAAGRELASSLINDDGDFAVDVAVPAAWLTGWVDVYLQLSSVGEPWREPAAQRVVRVEGVTWDAAP